MAENNKEVLEKKVIDVLENIKPYLQADGGDISFIELTDDYDVKVSLQGACHACPMSIQTLKLGVERTLKNAIPEIREVVRVY